MEFDEVIRKIKSFSERHSCSIQRKEYDDANRGSNIYGRICTSSDEKPPVWFSNPDRRTVFVFGPDSVHSVLLETPVPELLYRLGSDKDYLYHKVVEEKRRFWLVLFTVGPSSSTSEQMHVVPATWDGVLQHVDRYYPDAKQDLIDHMELLRHCSFEDFERNAGFKFLDSMRNKDKLEAHPPYFGYEHYKQLPKPRKAWQVRALLFCELRLLKLYSGDGYTVVEKTKEKGVLEYLCPNVSIKGLADTTEHIVLPLKVTADMLDRP